MTSKQPRPRRSAGPAGKRSSGGSGGGARAAPGPSARPRAAKGTRKERGKTNTSRIRGKPAAPRGSVRAQRARLGGTAHHGPDGGHGELPGGWGGRQPRNPPKHRRFGFSGAAWGHSLTGPESLSCVPGSQNLLFVSFPQLSSRISNTPESFHPNNLNIFQ